MPGKLVWVVLLALLVGCEERERLVFGPDPSDRQGPTSTINPPATDTTLTEGDPFVLGARSVDASGVDTVFIEVEGANLSYLPLDAEGEDTLSFSISLPTQGFAGRAIVIGVFGKDVLGNIGPTVTRRITIE
jgi:hypothetical protein